MTALGLVNGTWRNSLVEDWHADGRLTDGDMLRVNLHTTWRVREIVRRWRRSVGVSADDPIGTLYGLSVDDVAVLARRLFTWFIDAERPLPTGTVLRELALADLDEWSEHAENSLEDVIGMAENAGVELALRRAGPHLPRCARVTSPRALVDRPVRRDHEF